jgi:hypothetical protein
MKIPKKTEMLSPFKYIDPVFAFAIFMAVMLILLAVLPKAKEEKKEILPIAGNVFVTINWPAGLPQDIDLWVEGPDGTPVGYSNQRSFVFSYLRDDRGTDFYSPLNYELAVSQGIAPGQYIINLHFYAYHGGGDNVPIEADVVIKRPGRSDLRIFHDTVTLVKEGDEITVVQFQLDEEGNLIGGTLSREFIPVRNKPRFIE